MLAAAWGVLVTHPCLSPQGTHNAPPPPETVEAAALIRAGSPCPGEW